MKLDARLDMTGFDDFQAAFDREVKAAVVEMAQAQIVNQRMRANRGIDISDSPMPQYAASTAAARRRKGLRAGRIKLQNTGSMLRSLHVDQVKRTPEGWEARIAFSIREDAQKAAWNQVRTPWFGMSPGDQETLREIAAQRLTEIRSRRRNAR